MKLPVLLLSSLLCGTGCWLVTSEWRELRLPDIRATIRAFGSREEKKGISDAVVGGAARLLTPHIRLSSERKEELLFELETAHLPVTPELFTAQNIAMALLVLVLGLVFGVLFWPGFFPAGAVGAVLVYRSQAGRTLKEKKRIEGIIDSCMPAFASYVCSYVRVNHNVLEMLCRYREKCEEPILREELDITIADANSSGIEAALIRFDARAHSPQLSSIVRALITLANGTYRIEHFEQLEAQFEQKEKERLARQAVDVPEKLKPYNYGIYAAFALMLMVLFFIIFIRFTGQLL